MNTTESKEHAEKLVKMWEKTVGLDSVDSVDIMWREKLIELIAVELQYRSR